MNSPVTELQPQCNEGHVDTAGSSSKDCCLSHICPISTEIPIWSWPTSNISLPGIVPNHHYTVQSEMLDPLNLRYHIDSFIDPYQSTQCELTYSDCFLEPQLSQYHLVSGPVPAPPDCNHHNSVSTSWCTNEPNLCSMMPDELHQPVAMDHQQFQEGWTEAMSHITQPMVCNVSGGEQLALVNPRQPGPVFLTMESASAQRNDTLTQGKGYDISVLGTSSQYHQTASPLYEARDQTVRMQLPTRNVGMFCESKSRKPCHCTRSQCLKLYCECFSSGVMCSNCDCSNCHNNPEHEMKRLKAIKWCLDHNPDAFRPKIAGVESGGWHNKGCNCKRSGCLKRYCECYEANIMCTSGCKCVGCKNYDASSQTGSKDETVNMKDKWPISVIIPAVVEAVCDCLLTQAEVAERGTQSPAQGERMVLDEFGHCLSQIAKAMFEKKSN